MKNASLRSAWLVPALLAGLSGTPDEAAAQLPGMTRTYQVEHVVRRGPYLDAMLVGAKPELRFFFPADETCTALVRAEASVEYVSEGPFGKLRGGEAVCEPVGIGSLRTWRDRGPRGQRGEMIPRSRATFSVVYEDEQVAFARGRFLLASRVGWTSGADTLAVIPVTAVCSPILKRGQASVEFRPAGPRPFSLVTREGHCPIEGFIRPIPPLL